MSARAYVITTDSCTDLPLEYYREHDVPFVELHYEMDGELYRNYDPRITPREFYDRMRAGSMPVTQQINPQQARDMFEEMLKSGRDILHLAFSSGLSGSYNSACIARDELKEEYPDARIVVVDSLAASLGQGLLLHYALQKKEQGLTLDETARWLEEHKLELIHVFTVDDLNHLQRGGRISKATALVGTLLGIKPLLHVDLEGHLNATGKVRGRRQSLLALVENMGKQVGDLQNDVCFICQSDCEEDARFVADAVRERFHVKEFLIHDIGPIIGSHTGPGTIGLFFMGRVR